MTAPFAHRLAFSAALFTTLALAVAPAEARVGKLIVNGIVTAGTDGGTDLDSVSVVNNHYIENFVPGAVFGALGSLSGQAIRFTLLYDTANAPAGVAGLFDDPSGNWPYLVSGSVAINGVERLLFNVPNGASYFVPSATLSIGDGTPDTLAGHFGTASGEGSVNTTYLNRNIAFAATLPASFFSTDATLPGDVATPHFGFAHSPATGSGSFDFTQNTCFINCSFKEASGTFAVTAVAFAGVPDAPTWAMLIGGLGLTGLASRRRFARSVAA
jgi:hypothetical protein